MTIHSGRRNTLPWMAFIGITVAIGAVPANAQDATWRSDPASGDFSTASNWDPATVPTGTAFFEVSNTTTVTNARATTVGGLTLKENAGAYVFNNEALIIFDGDGFVVEGGSATFLNNDTANFTNSSTAGPVTINNDNELFFSNTSSADRATINNLSVDREIVFRDNSTAGSATIANDGDVIFQGNSSAGSSTIINGSGSMFFVGASTAGSATIANTGLVLFNQQSDGGQAQIKTDGSGVTDFSASTGPMGNQKLAVGSIAGAGSYYLGANELTVGGNGLSTEVSGVISDCGPTGTECATPSTMGSLVKTGTGTLTLSGASTFTGPTAVNGGRLLVDGAIVSDVTVLSGLLGGTGTVGAATVNNGATIAPGNSIGTMTVNGDFLLSPGAVYEAEVNAAGQGDQIVVNGTVGLDGSVLRVMADSGDYQASTDYVIIDNDGSDAVTGNFESIDKNLAFLDPSVVTDGGDGNDVVLTLTRNDMLFQDLALTRNHRIVAEALDRSATDDALTLALLNQSASGARQAFDALSGEIHATVPGILAQDSRYAREAVLGRLVQARHGEDGALAAGGPQLAFGGDPAGSTPQQRGPLAVWTQGFGAWAEYDTDGNAGSADRDLGGFISGLDVDVGGGWRVGLATGASFSNVNVSARLSGADVETYHLGGYVGGMAGALALRGGGLWAWNSIDTSRSVVFPGFYELQNASYDADTAQVFAEVAYPATMGGVSVEPFGGIAFVSVDTDSFNESGGSLASLSGTDTDQNVTYTTLGVRAATTAQWGEMQITPHIAVAWQHAFDDVTPEASLAFTSNGIGFSFEGLPLAEDLAIIDAGLDFALGKNGTASVSYSGQFGDGVTDNAVKVLATWLF